MNKRIVSIFCTLMLVISFNVITYAENEEIKPPAPPTVTEDLDMAINDIDTDTSSGSSTQSSILLDWSCKISMNQNNSIYLIGRQNAFYYCDQRLTLYLQKWNGVKWEDVTSWIFIEFNTTGILKDASFSFFERGNYYRARAVHYAKYGSQTHTTESTAPYIYVE